MKAAPQHRPVIVWLWSLYAMVLVMVIIGGITRLSGSGLSMVEWRPLMGTLPPMTDAEWQRVFGVYQQSPQYQLVNNWMTLADFKRIFYWEYLHRLFGRLIGLVFLIPYVWFLVRGHLRHAPRRRIFLAFIFGGLQGALGWFMVKSGLVDMPHVSHFRLAAHLLLAFFVAHWILWIIFAMKHPANRRFTADGATAVVWGFLGLLTLQVAWGAFMAGSRAGYMYQSFPGMNGEWLPAVVRAEPSLMAAFINHPAGIHFMHRLLAYTAAATGIAAGLYLWGRCRQPQVRRAVVVLIVAIVAQFVIGVLTVVNAVPIPLAVFHQAVGFLTVTAALRLLYALGTRSH